jgi:hypothetical protein
MYGSARYYEFLLGGLLDVTRPLDEEERREKVALVAQVALSSFHYRICH